MLASLYIENIAVVRRAEIELGGGLTVLTGETGAGKSVIIDSIRLLMGARAQKEQIRRGENSATVAGPVSYTHLSRRIFCVLRCFMDFYNLSVLHLSLIHILPSPEKVNGSPLLPVKETLQANSIYTNVFTTKRF